MEEVSKPTCIVEYKHMSGVDLPDQMVSYYPFTRKNLGWTKKVFLHQMEIHACKPHLLYQTRAAREVKHFVQIRARSRQAVDRTPEGECSGGRRWQYTNRNDLARVK